MDTNVQKDFNLFLIVAAGSAPVALAALTWLITGPWPGFARPVFWMTTEQVTTLLDMFAYLSTGGTLASYVVMFFWWRKYIKKN